MKVNPWYLAAFAPFALLLAAGEYGAQVMVLGLTLGIFFGTLSLRGPVRSDATTTHHG